MKIPHQALVALANGEKFVLMRNVGQPLEPKLERVSELDLELTNFSAGANRHEERSGRRDGISEIDELAHGAAIAEWLNTQVLRGGIEQIVIAADPKTLGEIRQHTHKELQGRVIGEVAKDLVNQPVQAIEQALVAA